MLWLVSCKKENRCDCIKSTGTTTTTYRNVADFTSISIENKMDIYLTQDSTFEIKVEAGSNLQSLIKTERDGETLKVFNNNKCNWVRGYNHTIKVYITAPYFKHILHYGLGTIKTNNTITQDTLICTTRNSGDIKLNINTTTILCSAHGNGDIYLSGKTARLDHDYTGTNFLYAYDLIVTNYLYLHNLTIGKTFINAPENGLMDIILEEAGNVYYKGNPSHINLTRIGKGNLIKQ